jgi:SWI/SNF-related matrix-associated actin-dependent regulator 1 of chromatin subfamily A
MPFQVAGIAFLSSRGAALLADDAGLGKSLQMIRAAQAAGAQRILVLCAAVGRVSWRLQFAEWDTERRPVWFYPYETAFLLPSGPCAVVVTFDWLSNKNRANALMTAMDFAEKFDVAFVDEAHNLKNPKANRTRVVYGPHLDRKIGVLSRVKKVWVATATLTPIHAGEMFTHLNAILPEVVQDLLSDRTPSYQHFLHRFCHVRQTTYGDKVEGNNPDTIPALAAAIKPHLILRTKAEVLSELPPILTSLLPVEVATSAQIAEAKELQGLTDDEFLVAVAVAWADPSYSTQRRALGLLKVEAVWPWIKDFLDNNPTGKLIIFAHHRDVIAALSKMLDRVFVSHVTIHGGTKPTYAGLHVDLFQHNPVVRVFLGQNRAANTSITLTAASTVLMLEPDPSPAQNYQAISRAHRIGQTGRVNALFVCEAKNPIEIRLVNIIRRRAADNAALFGVETPGVA